MDKKSAEHTHQVLYNSSIFVQQLGEVKLENGKTLSQKLTISNVSLWDIVSVEMALYPVFNVFSGAPKPTLLQKIKPLLSWLKHTAFNRDLNNIKYSNNNPKSTDKLKFLFLGFSRYIYRDVLDPIVEEYSKAGSEIVPVVLYDKEKPMPAAEYQNDIFNEIWHYWTPAVKASAISMRKDLRKVITEINNSKELANKCNQYLPHLWEKLKPVFNWLFLVRLPQMLAQIAIARQVLLLHQPKLIICPDLADPRNRIYYVLAKQLSIPVLDVQFGSSGMDSLEWRFFMADQIAVWGEHSRDILLKHGVPDEKITITGSARYDALVAVPPAVVTKIREDLALHVKNTIILFASTFNDSHYSNVSDPHLLDKMKLAIFTAVDELEGVTLIVKPHPREIVAETKSIAGSLRNIQFFEATVDIRELIKVCDAFVSLGSTTIVDSLVANKPTICPVFPGWQWNDFFIESGAVLVPRTTEEIKETFKTIINGSYVKTQQQLAPYREQYLGNMIFKADGKSAERIKTLAMQMVEINN